MKSSKQPIVTTACGTLKAGAASLGFLWVSLKVIVVIKSVNVFYKCSQWCCGSGSGAFLTPGSRIRDGKKSRSRSGNIPDNISESLETIFWDKILKFFDADPGSGNLFDPGSGRDKIRIRNKLPGSATLHFQKGNPENMTGPCSGE